MKKKDFQELTTLFFDMRQTIRANLPRGRADPNAWMRCETLRFVGEKGKPTMRELATQLRITAPSATSIVRKLIRLGWIGRAASDADKRIVRVKLTAKGKKELARYRAQSEKVMRKVFSKLPERELSHLRQALRRLRDVHSA